MRREPVTIKNRVSENVPYLIWYLYIDFAIPSNIINYIYKISLIFILTMTTLWINFKIKFLTF